MKAITDCPANFDSLKGLRKWLFSETVKTKQQDANWPTPKMRGPWIDFVDGFRNPVSRKWQIRLVTFPVQWEVKPLPIGSSVRIFFRQEINETVVYSVDLDRLGTIVPSFGREPAGVFRGKIAEDGHSLECVYSGPADIVFEQK